VFRNVRELKIQRKNPGSALQNQRELLVLVVLGDQKKGKIRIDELVVFMKEPLKRSSPSSQT
jgi:hypothetical protein